MPPLCQTNTESISIFLDEMYQGNQDEMYQDNQDEMYQDNQDEEEHDYNEVFYDTYSEQYNSEFYIDIAMLIILTSPFLFYIIL